MTRGWLRFALAVLLGLANTASAQPAPRLWTDPGAIASRDLRSGIGGSERRPDITQPWTRVDAQGKDRWRDRNGRVWKLREGRRFQGELAANRLLWAIGYPATPMHFIREVRLSGVSKPTRNVVAVLQDFPSVSVGNWRWTANAFEGSRELSGLRVVMALINNTDLSDDANEIVLDRDTDERVYRVAGLSSTFGRGGEIFYRSRAQANHFSVEPFVRSVGPDTINFYCACYRRKVVEQVPSDHVRWVEQLLSQLTRAQVDDAFRAGGFSDSDVTSFADSILRRIAQIRAPE